MNTPVAAHADEPTESAPDPLRVPLLRERLERVDPEHREHWLDLGAIQPVLLDRLGCGPNRLVVADLVLQPREDALPFSLRLLDRGPSPERFDMLLAWDWPNYLDADGLRRFGTRLARHSRPGALLHALIHYRAERMAPAPRNYRLTADCDLRVREPEQTAIPAPRHSPKALEKAMPHWQVDRTLLLNNGMQEFVLRRRDGMADDPSS